MVVQVGVAAVYGITLASSVASILFGVLNAVIVNRIKIEPPKSEEAESLVSSKIG